MHFIEVLDLAQLFRVAGILGFVCYMASFAALQFGVIEGQGMAYSALNILAASLVLVSLVSEFNLASALIQVSWIIIGFAGIFVRVRQIRKGEPQPDPTVIPAE